MCFLWQRLIFHESEISKEWKRVVEKYLGRVEEERMENF
jgi:hypothetical protein